MLLIQQAGDSDGPGGPGDLGGPSGGGPGLRGPGGSGPGLVDSRSRAFERGEPPRKKPRTTSRWALDKDFVMKNLLGEMVEQASNQSCEQCSDLISNSFDDFK